ncbi:MAG: saccharopine dehydrogenase C-terminal domain-containing protein, partial [Candidatus Eisenbacteria bacterium]
ASAAVTVADVRRPDLPQLANLSWVEADASDKDALARLISGFDLAVGALPSRFGYGAMQAAIEARRPMVDVSFSGEDPLALDAAARKAGVTIAPDCGLAPGLSHLLAGDLYARYGAPEFLEILVGGVAQDASRPYGYVVTWSLDDLVEEYTRPARIVRGGEAIELPVFSETRPVEVVDVGTMEAFLSDGLRTLITTLPGVSAMEEKTLRWPGHVAAIQPLLASGRFLDEFRAKCVVDPPEDLVALVVRARWADGRAQAITMVDRYDPKAKLTAMARTTAFTTSVMAQLAAQGGMPSAGVLPPEWIARNPDAVRFVIDAMASRGVTFRSS